MAKTISTTHFTITLFSFAIAMIVVSGLCLLALDGMLLTEEIDTRVHHFLKSTGSLVYVVPESGGELDTCPIEGSKLRALQPNTEIVVEKTPILGRCTDVKPIRCVDFMCSSGADNVINTGHFIQNAIHYAFGDKYANLGELRKEYPGFSPQIRRWPIIRGIWNPVRYSVRLPEKLVILDTNGNTLTSRECGSDEGYCQKILRRQIEKGVASDIGLSEPKRR